MGHGKNIGNSITSFKKSLVFQNLSDLYCNYKTEYKTRKGRLLKITMQTKTL